MVGIAIYFMIAACTASVVRDVASGVESDHQLIWSGLSGLVWPVMLVGLAQLGLLGVVVAVVRRSEQPTKLPLHHPTLRISQPE